MQRERHPLKRTEHVPGSAERTLKRFPPGSRQRQCEPNWSRAQVIHSWNDLARFVLIRVVINARAYEEASRSSWERRVERPHRFLQLLRSTLVRPYAHKQKGLSPVLDFILQSLAVSQWWSRCLWWWEGRGYVSQAWFCATLAAHTAATGVTFVVLEKRNCALCYTCFSPPVFFFFKP